MAEKVTLRLSNEAAAYAGKDTPREKKLLAASGEIPLPEPDLATLLFFLAHDQDPVVRSSAVATVRSMTGPQLAAVADSPFIHHRVLDMLAHVHFGDREFADKLLAHPAIDSGTAAFLREKLEETAAGSSEPEADETDTAEASDETAEEAGPEDFEEVDEESDEFLSKYQLSLKMEVPEKIKLALVGDKEWRTLLIKDSNKMVSSAVIKNPRITDGEILGIVSSNVQNDEIMRLICHNKEWIKNYQIRKALVQNCKTPLQTALRLITSLTDKDLSSLAKSKNVTTVISTQARRILMSRKKH